MSGCLRFSASTGIFHDYETRQRALTVWAFVAVKMTVSSFRIRITSSRDSWSSYLILFDKNSLSLSGSIRQATLYVNAIMASFCPRLFQASIIDLSPYQAPLGNRDQGMRGIQ
jgi:hypothetical protein